MSLLVASLLAVIGVEYVLKTPFIPRAKSLLKVINKSINVIRSRKISDHWKEIVLLRYSRDLVGHTLFLFSILTGLFLLIVLPAILIDRQFQPSPTVIDALSSVQGLIVITVVSGAYVFVRRRIFTV